MVLWREQLQAVSPSITQQNCTALRARARETSSQHRGSPLPTYFKIVNRRIAALSERKTDPFHDEIMDFAAFMEGRLPQSLIHTFW